MPNYSFKKYQPLGLRLWHWLNAIAILGLLSTVLIRKTLLSWRTNSVLIQEKLSAAGTTIKVDLAKEIAVAIRDPLWDWHVYLGFTLGVLLLGRFVVFLFVEKKRFNIQVLNNLLRIKSVPATERRDAIHFNFVKLGYIVFYLATLLMVATGLTLNFKADLNLSKDLIGVTKEVHEFMLWFFILFAGGHVVGVVVAENRSDQGIVSDMINGGVPRKK